MQSKVIYLGVTLGFLVLAAPMWASSPVIHLINRTHQEFVYQIGQQNSTPKTWQRLAPGAKADIAVAGGAFILFRDQNDTVVNQQGPFSDPDTWAVVFPVANRGLHLIYTGPNLEYIEAELKSERECQ